jgi:hypothetical protein
VSFYTTSPLANGSSATFVPGETWTSFTVAFYGSNAGDVTSSVSVQGSTDEGGTIWVPLTPTQSIPLSGDMGAKIFANMPVNAVKVTGVCAAGDTVTATVTGA